MRAGRICKAVLSAAGFALVAGGLFYYWAISSRLVRVGDVRIDPLAHIDPNRHYRLVVWEHEVPLPWEEGAHREALAAAVEEFTRVWPNVTVDVQFFEWDEGHGKLREAIANGSPPDVYGMPLGVRLIDAAWQIPIDAYLTQEAAQDLLESARRAVALDGRSWAWPRWVLPSLWVAREDLTPSLGEARPSWTAEQFLEAAADAKTKAGAWGLVANPFDPYLFVDVIVASTGKNLIGADGRRAWTTEEIEAGLSFFKELIDRGITDADAGRMSRTRLASFWNRRAAVVAPTTPWLMRHLLTRGGASGGRQSGEEPLPESAGHLALPVPPPAVARFSGALRATVAGYAVFRQEPYQGDDHTRLAMFLAEHLSRRLGPWEAAHLFAAPAHPSALERWRVDAGLPAKELDLIVEWAKAALAPPLLDTHAEQQARAVEELAGEFAKLWSGGDPADLAVQIAIAVDGLRAEVGHP